MSKPSSTIKTKKGAASFYVVIFVSLVISVITLSFIRIMLRDATNTTDSDLSQSAYDSALAGVEDAKSALIRCQHDGNCNKVVGDTCNKSANYLYGDRGVTTEPREVQLAETQTVGEQGGSAFRSSEAQAYTCVKITGGLTDYRVTMSPNLRIKVIPLNVQAGFSGARSVEVSWFSSRNKTDPEKSSTDLLQQSGKQNYYFGQNGVAKNDSDSTIAPSVLSAELIQADTNFTFNDMVTSGNSRGTDRSLTVLYPVSGSIEAAKNQTVRSDEMLNNGNVNKLHTAHIVQCNDHDNREFACKVKLEIPSTLRGSKNNEVAYLVLTTPYGNSEVDVSVSVLDDGGNPMGFQDTQYKVDSTGRANDIYRRVETRVELGNINFPFPEYVAQLGLSSSSGTGSALNKNFWVTNNCQRTAGELLKGTDPESTNYRSESCANSGNVGGS